MGMGSSSSASLWSTSSGRTDERGLLQAVLRLGCPMASSVSNQCTSEAIPSCSP